MHHKIFLSLSVFLILLLTISCTNSITVSETSIDLSDYDGSSIKIEEAGEYTLTGTMTDGQVIVDAGDDEVTLILYEVSITSSDDAPIYVSDGTVTIYLADGSENELIDTENNSSNAVLYSKDDLIITGNGSLYVEANGNDGITSSNGLTIESGSIEIEAADDGIQGEDFIIIEDGTINISAGTSSGTGLKADDEDSNYITINGGDITISQSYEGIESMAITINAGSIDITSSDDGINVAGGSDDSGFFTSSSTSSDYYLKITGGVTYIDSDGDGLDSNGSISMTGGTVIVNGPTSSGDGAIDYDGSFSMNGGTLAAAGSDGMAEAPSSSSNGCLDITFSSTLSAGKLITIFNSSDELVMAYAPTKAFNSLIFTSDGIVSGSTYYIYTGGSVSGTENNGWYSDAEVSSSGTYYSALKAD